MTDKLAVVLTRFNEDREYISDGYYRVKSFGNDTYELEYAIAGACGTFDCHPAIKFKLMPDTHEIEFLLYRDMVANPIKFITPESDADLTVIRAAFDQLVDRCYQFK